MDETILHELYCIYFEKHPMQAVTNDELGDTHGFAPEIVANARWAKEKLIIKRTKEVAQPLNTMIWLLIILHDRNCENGC